MTTIYFIRHAESDISVRDGETRPLTEKGMRDCKLVTEYLSDKNIDTVFSSPYKRAVDTVSDFAEKSGLEIETIDNFRERKSDSNWQRDTDFWSFIERQWNDFDYKLSDGENLREVQTRNIEALEKILRRSNCKGKNIVIGTHGTALSTIINYYDKSYGYRDFMAMVKIMPWVVKMYFDGEKCAGIEKIDLFFPQAPDYSAPKVTTANLGELGGYRFVVIFAKYKDQSSEIPRWLYCYAKTRDCYETAGGHIEHGETPLEAAKREFYEETGAIKFEITPAFDYSVKIPTAFSHGQVFFAEIHELEKIPNYEETITDTKLFDSIPDKMRFPKILPVLYDKMQTWLNLQSAKDEIWDVYDCNRNLKGRTHRRGDPLPEGDFHLVVHVWIMNSRGEYLITKRTPNKGYPNMWECTGGSAVAGDDSKTAAVREVREETGLSVAHENGECMMTLIRDDSICDIWLFRQDFDINDVIYQENETCGAMWASQNEIKNMIKSGEFIPFHYLNEFFRKIEDRND